MFNAEQLRELIIRPALNELIAYSDSALELMTFTCAVESEGGTYLKQIKGPALGIYQMEPNTYNDIWQNYIKSNHSLLLQLLSNFGVINMPSEDRLIYDLKFATAMTRIHYLRVNSPLPQASDIDAIWDYYKEHYNTINGAATKNVSIAKYQAFLKA
jgi:hypothetical protein